MPLSDSAVKAAKPAEKPVRLYDSGGLYLEVSPAGGKLWRLKYRYGGKEKRLSFGAYPAVGLKDARERRDAARKVLAEGLDPGEQRKAQKAALEARTLNAFEVVCREWLEKWRTTVEPAQYTKALARLEKNVFPWLGSRPIAEITAPEVLAVLRRVDERGARYSVRLFMIDLDGALYVEYDDRDREPLALIETAQDVGQKTKACTVTARLAQRSGLPAYVVLYQLGNEANPADLSQPDILMFRVRRIWPQPEAAWRTLTPWGWAEALLQIRRWACAKLDGVAANDPRW